MEARTSASERDSLRERLRVKLIMIINFFF